MGILQHFLKFIITWQMWKYVRWKATLVPLTHHHHLALQPFVGFCLLSQVSPSSSFQISNQLYLTEISQQIMFFSRIWLLALCPTPILEDQDLCFLPQMGQLLYAWFSFRVIFPQPLGFLPLTCKAAVAALIYRRHLLARSQDSRGEYVIFNGCSLATGYPLTL